MPGGSGVVVGNSMMESAMNGAVNEPAAHDDVGTARARLTVDPRQRAALADPWHEPWDPERVVGRPTSRGAGRR
jgi:hypothetical protein